MKDFDFTRAASSKNYKKSFYAQYNKINNIIHENVDQFEILYQQSELNRKQLADAIERCIYIIKKNNIKIEKPLDQYEREELPKLLTSFCDKVLEKEELINCSLIIEEKTNKIKIYEEQIEQLNQFFVSLNQILVEPKIDEYNIEQDYDEEVTVSLSDLRSKRMKEKKENVILPVKEDKYTEYTVQNDQSLIQMVEYLYGDKNCYNAFCMFNEDIINALCEYYNVNLNELLELPEILRGKTFKVPDEIITYNKVETKSK